MMARRGYFGYALGCLKFCVEKKVALAKVNLAIKN